MTDEYRNLPAFPGDLRRRFKLIGTDPVTGDPLYAEVLALEAGSIGGGGGGVASSVTVADGVTPTQLLAVDASGRITANINGTIPVSGTFWQATQPVSGAFFQATQPVSGTFWQATQPVSGPLTDTQLRASAVPVSGTFWQATQPVSGAFFQATQPVSLATNTPDVTDRAARLLGHVTVDNASLAVTGTFFQATQPVSGTVTVTPPTLTKGTQGATGFSVQRLNDAGRNTRIFMLDTITAAPVAEALATVVQWYGNAAVAGTTTPAVVPAGKTLRLTGYKIQYQSLATVGYAVVRIRFNTGGVAVLASPLVASFESGTNSGATTTAVTGAITTETGSFPEGLELPAGGGIGFTVAGYGPTGTLTLEGGVRFEVHGYEY